jgi:hypothetical protein
MQTLIFNDTKVSTDVWVDDAVITLTAKIIYAPGFNIGDMNSTNATLIENVTPPTDWVGGKYLYDNGTWTINPKWVAQE